MESFSNELTKQFARQLSNLYMPTVGDVVNAIRNACEAVDLANRLDVESFSVIAEFGKFEDQCLLLLSLHFDLNQSDTREPLDFRGSLACEFKLDATIPCEVSAIEFDNMLPLEEVFASILSWEPFQLLKDRSLPFAWYGPEDPPALSNN